MNIFALLVVYQVKHYLCDFPLQGRYMLGKFKGGWDWILPLTAHCSVHAAFTFAIATLMLGPVAGLAYAAFDFVMHFGMDRVKASPNILGRWKPDQSQFWLALGADQMWHHLTHYAIIYGLLNSVGG